MYMTNKKVCEINTYQKSITLYGGFEMDVTKVEDQYKVYCKDFDLFTWCDTLEETTTEFKDFLIGYFGVLYHKGTLSEFMNKCGWRVIEDEYEVIIVPPFIVKTSINFENITNANLLHY
jgi:hypothetical protein